MIPLEREGIPFVMIKAQNLTKYYGDNLGVSDVSFEANKNEIIGLLGRNGAGKTTILNIISGYIASTGGAVEIDGYDILKQPKKAKSKIGYLPEKPPIYMDMTVDEYLNFCAELKGIDDELIQKHIDELCSLTGINEVRNRLCKNISKGYKQRVGLAQALVGNPEILILDEPTIGLDPRQIVEIRQLIKKLGKKHTVILSSHILGEIAQVCDRIIIVDNGRIVASDTLYNLSESLDVKRLIDIRIKNADEKFSNQLKSIKGVISAEPIGQKDKNSYDFQITCKNQTDIIEIIFDYVVSCGMKILMLKTGADSIEDVFLVAINKGEEGKR